MSVQFVLGRAGTGKTHWCVTEIVRQCRAEPLGKPVFWILPRQATFQAERELACGSELDGYFRCRVLSFEDLGRHVLNECGGAATGEISELGRRMVLGHVLRSLQNELRFFKDVALQPGMAAELDATLAELEHCGVAPADLLRAVNEIPDSSLNDKTYDLSLIFAAYNKFLGQDRLDPNRRLAGALESIQKSPTLRNADVFVDGFFDFTRRERQVLAALAKTCRHVYVTFTLDPDHPSIRDVHHQPNELDLFHRSIQAYRRLWFTFAEENIEIGESVLLRAGRRFEAADLTRLEKWDGQAANSSSPAVIELIEADDRRAEADAAARWIGRLAAQGLRFRDIGVLMRSQEDYRQFIEASFHEHGIPFFIDRRRTAAHHPLPRLIRAALTVARTNFARDAVLALLKTDLTELKPQEADELENYVLQQGIDHGLWTPAEPWHARRRADGDEESAESIDARNAEGFRRRLIDPLKVFVDDVIRKGQTVRGFASAIFALLERLNVRGKIVRWMEQAGAAGRLEEQAEHKLIWDEISALFDELVELLADQPITLADFQSLLDLALEDLQLAITPPTVDQVLVGSIDRTRTPGLKACAILGLAEGQFPRLNPEGTIFTDNDRRVLGGKQIDLDPDTQRQLLDENFLAYLAFTRASSRLLITRPMQNKPNQPAAPSPLWLRVLSAFPDAKAKPAPAEEQLPLGELATPRQLLGGLMHWVRDQNSKDGEAWRAIYDWVSRRNPRGDALDAALPLAWKALSYSNKAELKPEQSRRLFAEPLKASVRQLENFRACAYRHFALHGLELRPRQRQRAGPADLSHIYHEVLDEITGELIQSEMSWSDLDKGEPLAAIAARIEQVAGRLNSELLLPTSRSRYLIDRIGQTLRQVSAGQRAAAERSDFRPQWTSLAFGDEAGGSTELAMPPLKIRTTSGKEILIYGKIDRVDLSPDGLAVVIDYRLHAHRLDAAAAYHGVNLRLLIDLLALRQNGSRMANRRVTPVAAFTVGLLRDIEKRNSDETLSPDDPKFHLRDKPRGIVDFSAVRQLDNQIAAGWSDVLNVGIKQDGQLGWPNTSDAVESNQLESLLAHTERMIAELAEGILSGGIKVRPYRLGQRTPCGHCELRDLCRFDPALGPYASLETMSRLEMLEKVSG